MTITTIVTWILIQSITDNLELIHVHLALHALQGQASQKVARAGEGEGLVMVFCYVAPRKHG